MNERKICRFCLSNNSTTEYLNIFNNVLADFIHKIQNCLSMQVVENDGLPKFTCSDCLEKINNFDTFKKACCKSYELLRESKQTTCGKRDFYVKMEIFKAHEVNTTQVNVNIDEEIDNGHDIDNSELPDHLMNLKGWKKHQKDLWEPASKEVLAIIGDNIYPCDICQKPFIAFVDYHDHQLEHNGELVFKCDKCEMVFHQRQLLVQHDRKHRVICDICKMQLLPSSLRAHLLIHTDIHKCSICDTRHTSKASLEKHIQARHTNQKGFVCHVCGKQNSCQSSMNRHMAYHRDERPYKCKYCDFSAKSLNIVQVHTSRKHFAEKCVCEICAKIFKSQPSLLQHMKRIHSSRRHSCTICGKQFIEKYNLSKHMNKHVGQRLHECKICQNEFFTVRKLKDHMHSHKQGCVSCPKCGKEFFYKKYFNKHVVNCNKVLQTESQLFS